MGYPAAPLSFTTVFLLMVVAAGAVVAAASGSSSVPSRRRPRITFAAGWALFAAAQLVSGLTLTWPRRLLLAVRLAAIVAIAAVSVAAHLQASLKGLPRLAPALGLP